MASHYVVTLPDALEAHESVLEFGGRQGLVNIDGLLGALGRPYHGYHRPIHRKAAALLHAVATAHAFTDGNKRTSLLLMLLLIERSGYMLADLPGDRIDDEIVALVNHDITEDQFADWLRVRLHRA